MKTINGIGTKFLGVVKAGEHHLATTWIVFFYLPIFPLRRELVQFLPVPQQTLWQKINKGVIERNVAVIKQVPLDWKNVIITYICGWILAPLFLFGPVVLMLILNEYIRNMYGDNLVWGLLAAFGVIGWVIFSLSTLLRWENRAT